MNRFLRLPAMALLLAAVLSAAGCFDREVDPTATPNIDATVAGKVQETLTAAAPTLVPTPVPTPAPPPTATLPPEPTPTAEPVQATLIDTDLAVVIETGSASSAYGEALTFTFTVANHGSEPATSVVLEWTLRWPLTLISISPERLCIDSICNLGPIGAGEKVSGQLVVRPDSGFRHVADLDVRARVAGLEPESNRENNEDSITMPLEGPSRLLWATPLPSAGRPLSHSPVIGEAVYLAAARDVYALDKDTGEALWRYTTGGDAVVSAALGGAVIAGSYDGSVYSIDASAGSLNWRYYSGEEQRILPRVAGDSIYFVCELYICSVDASTGEMNWQHRANTYIWNGPKAAGNAVYYETDWHLFAVNESTGDLDWWYEVDNSGTFMDPQFADDILFVPSRTTVYALHTRTGSELWTKTFYRQFEDDSIASLLVDGDAVYLGTNRGEVIAMEALTGEVRWRYNLGSYALTSVEAAANGLVYLVRSGHGSLESADGLYALDASTGELQWRHETRFGADVFRRARLDGRVMYVLSYDGYLEAVDAISGDLKWRFSTGPEHPLIGIAVADGVLYGVNGERVFALAADSPK